MFFLSIPQAKVFISLTLLTLFVSLSSRAHTDCPYLFLKNSLPHCFGEAAVLRQRDGIIDIFFGVSTFYFNFFLTLLLIYPTFTYQNRDLYHLFQGLKKGSFFLPYSLFFFLLICFLLTLLVLSTHSSSKLENKVLHPHI